MTEGEPRPVLRQVAARPEPGARARANGSDWIYSYLKCFYIDEARPLGWNNTVFPSASMPNVLWELQGIQRPVSTRPKWRHAPVEKLVLATPGRQSPQQFDRPPAILPLSSSTWRAGRAQAPSHRRLGHPVPGLPHLHRLAAEVGILARRH